MPESWTEQNRTWYLFQLKHIHKQLIVGNKPFIDIMHEWYDMKFEKKMKVAMKTQTFKILLNSHRKSSYYLPRVTRYLTPQTRRRCCTSFGYLKTTISFPRASIHLCRPTMMTLRCPSEPNPTVSNHRTRLFFLSL